jgi:hypothetical protein
MFCSSISSKFPVFMKLENSPPCSQNYIVPNSPEPLYPSSCFITVIIRINFNLRFILLRSQYLHHIAPDCRTDAE